MNEQKPEINWDGDPTIEEHLVAPKPVPEKKTRKPLSYRIGEYVFTPMIGIIALAALTRLLFWILAIPLPWA